MMVYVPIVFYFAARFWIATDYTGVLFCSSRIAVTLSKVFTVIGAGLFAVMVLYLSFCALKRAHEDGRWFYLPTDLKAWASEEDVNPIVYIGIGILSCGLIELLHRLCCWWSQ